MRRVAGVNALHDIECCRGLEVAVRLARAQNAADTLSVDTSGTHGHALFIQSAVRPDNFPEHKAHSGRIKTVGLRCLLDFLSFFRRDRRARAI